MKYLIELQFNSGVHIGSDHAGYGKENAQGYAHADTIFSAIINSLTSIKHEFVHLQWVNNFFDKGNDKPRSVPFVISSFGFIDIEPGNNKYYLPVPLIKPITLQRKISAYYQKQFKKRKFISLEYFYNWQNNMPLDLEIIIEKDRDDFWTETLRGQHLRDSISAATQIFNTGIAFYAKSIRPFFIIDLDEKDMSFDDLLKILHVTKFSGLGGKRAGGNGAFEIDEEGWFRIDNTSIEEQKKLNPNFSIRKNEGRVILNNILNKKDNKLFYLFSTLYSKNIKEEDLFSYNLIPRKGWLYSNTSFTQLKRKTCYMLAEGSLLRKDIAGELVDVSPDAFNEHKVLRYGLPFYIPFSEVKNEEYN